MKQKVYLRDTFNGDCAEMEGASIAHTAYLNKTPYVVIRAISDKAESVEHRWIILLLKQKQQKIQLNL
ncbi:MAG: hypothetical protein ACLRR3_01420 [Eubacterium sp.]